MTKKSTQHKSLEFPYDRELLQFSPLYRKSRTLYLQAGNRFEQKLISSRRSLSSPTLLSSTIEYTPLKEEFEWRLKDPIEKKNKNSLLEIRPYISSLFHEQNHRILWKLLPPAPREKAQMRRYLNFAESLVIATDMALADELGIKRSAWLFSCGIIYDPGTNIKSKIKSKRIYRNYLQTCLYGTYLSLEGFDTNTTKTILTLLFSNLLAPPLLSRATERATKLSIGFITNTNLVWQKKHFHLAVKSLSKKGQPGLILETDPLKHFQQYALAEMWFDTLKL